MKRFLVCLAVLVGVVALGLGTARAAVRYELEEVGISIELPEDYSTITRDTPADDPAYDVFGLDKESADELFEQNNSYLDAMSPRYEREISVTMIPTQGLKDFSWLDETFLETYEDMLRAQTETAGGTYVGSEVYRNQQATFIKLYTNRTVDEFDLYGMVYYTIYDGRTINVNFFSYAGELTQEDETLLQEIVDSVNFTTVQGQEELSEAWEYTDPDSGLSFTMPAGWLRQDVMEVDGNIKMAAAYQLQPGLVLQYSSVDAWGQMSPGERAGLERRDADQSLITKKDIAEIYQIDVSEVSTVTYGGKEYYMAWVDLGTLTGMDLGGLLERTVLVRVENGFMYQFFFSAKFADPQFKDMKAILDSARYPELEPAIPTPLPSIAPINVPAYTGTRNAGRDGVDSQTQFVLAVVAFAVIGVTALLLGDWFRRKKARDGERNAAPAYSFVPAQPTPAREAKVEAEPPVPAPVEPSAEAVPVPAEEPIRCCPQCGMQVPAEVRFCHRCGSRLQPEEGKETDAQ